MVVFRRCNNQQARQEAPSRLVQQQTVPHLLRPLRRPPPPVVTVHSTGQQGTADLAAMPAAQAFPPLHLPELVSSAPTCPCQLRLANGAGMPLPATTSSRESSLVVAVANAWQINSHSASSIDHLDQAVLQAVGEVLRIEADPAVLQRPDHLHRRSRHLRALPRSTHCTSNSQTVQRRIPSSFQLLHTS